MDKKILHFISHTHWDREWYMDFEKHRFRLVELMDKLFEAFDKNPDFKSFHMDGQIVVLEDYLEIKPYMLEKVKKYVREGRLKIGPWYVLQDEYLTSSEANVRNMLYGMRLGEQYGPVTHIGYFPDAFGNISQAPQLMQGFGIDNAVFGRGINPIGFDNTVFDTVEDYTSELVWKSPDGSEVIGILFANWYHNAWEVPEDPKKAIAYISRVRDNAAKVARTPHLLMMNGCDHEPVQTNLPDILKSIQDQFPDVLLHSSFEEYLTEIRKYRDQLQVVEGELSGQHTNGYCSLLNTASSRIYLKQLNHQAQNLLEKWAEPLGVMSWLQGDTYRNDFFLHTWKVLMQNHPHDSICGCSVDAVHDEMVTRFQKSISITNELVNREVQYLTAQVDTSSLQQDQVPVIVFNPLIWEVSDSVEVKVDFEEHDTVTAGQLAVMDDSSAAIAADIREIGRTFTYTLPDDWFRQVRYVKRFAVAFRAEAIPVLGYKTFTVVRTAPDAVSDLQYGSDFAENSFLRVEIGENGALRITNKKNGYVFDRCNIFEDTGDIGEEYNYTQMRDGKAITTENAKAQISLQHAGKASVTFEVKVTIEVPARADKAAGVRSDEMVPFTLISYITLGEKSRRVDIRTKFDNQAKDHRVRALFPTNLATEYCYSDGQFDIVKRSIQPWKGWENPSNCYRQMAFTDLYDGVNGLVVANRGLNEFEVLRDGSNTLALTLVRSVAELGDWGYFPTPGAQCQGWQEVEYSVIPYAEDTGRAEAYRQGYQFHGMPFRAIQTDRHTGALPMKRSFLDVKAENLMVSAFKKYEDRDSVLLRIYNLTEQPQSFDADVQSRFAAVFETNLKEERQHIVPVEDGCVRLTIPGKKIVTLEFVK